MKALRLDRSHGKAEYKIQWNHSKPVADKSPGGLSLTRNSAIPTSQKKPKETPKLLSRVTGIFTMDSVKNEMSVLWRSKRNFQWKLQERGGNQMPVPLSDVSTEMPKD
ncbi:hypothetical protein TWF281_002448 [Arthrobotrys megalospora]